MFTMLLLQFHLAYLQWLDISEIHVGPSVPIIVEMGSDQKKMCYHSICWSLSLMKIFFAKIREKMCYHSNFYYKGA